MKIVLLKALGSVGVITELKTVLSDAYLTVEVIGADEGTLIIRDRMLNDRAYSVKNGKARIPEYELLAGKSAVVFQTSTEKYVCGAITRNGRFLSLDNNSDKLIVACATALEEQAKRYDELCELVKAIDRQFRLI